MRWNDPAAAFLSVRLALDNGLGQYSPFPCTLYRTRRRKGQGSRYTPALPHHQTDSVYSLAIGGMASVSTRSSTLLSTCLFVVDRSNGFEKKYFQRQNDRSRKTTEAYNWSVDDM